MALYGVGIDIHVKRIISEFQLYVSKQKGGVSLKGLKSTFNKFDKNGNGKLDEEQLEKALNSFGFFLQKYDLQALIKYYDLDGDKCISYEEFVLALQEPMNERRKAIVTKVFSFFDTDGSGVITVSDLKKMFNFSKNIQVKLGVKTEEQLIKEFISHFEITKDGNLTKDEFIAFYQDFSQGVSSDEIFLQIIYQTWGIKEDNNFETTRNEVKSTLQYLREKLIAVVGANQKDEAFLKQVFKEFDLNKDGFWSINELELAMNRLSVPYDQKYLQGVFSQIDLNRSGCIEYDEFIQLLKKSPFA